VTTTARSSRSPASSSTAAAHAAVRSAVIALRFSGRSNVSTATPSAPRSTRSGVSPVTGASSSGLPATLPERRAGAAAGGCCGGPDAAFAQVQHGERAHSAGQTAPAGAFREAHVARDDAIIRWNRRGSIRRGVRMHACGGGTVL
jgi:hypothetical protein